MNYNAFYSNTPDDLEWIAPGVAIVPWWPRFELGVNVYLRIIFTPIVSNKRASWVIHDANAGTFHTIGRGELSTLSTLIATSVNSTGRNPVEQDPREMLRKCRVECDSWGR